MYEFRSLLISRTDRKQAIEVFAVELERLGKEGWHPVTTNFDYTPAYEGGQRQQYIWQCVLSKEVPDDSRVAEANLR